MIQILPIPGLLYGCAYCGQLPNAHPHTGCAAYVAPIPPREPTVEERIAALEQKIGPSIGTVTFTPACTECERLRAENAELRKQINAVTEEHSREHSMISTVKELLPVLEALCERLRQVSR